ncbi:hypothetical protein RGV33_18765 [Pseudomonas sp. Bout1]|uniref:dermonecrotic toxin domain-containing protein n=1 Tax=Pseudomonas sp. Bout1 TaxID=3048600 RepID=UPI002AB5056C|nr:DUF6543 domain-containing protein [Pseudomonas sp. Bout1]MDY7533702.1 hypothetical protein [Pseudomonas sp. Bout1]MEB0186072.1 hypothetical protein [Pseudomonas sp. Bout1]
MPYFFAEAMRVGWKVLDRERQLNITPQDIEFLGKVFIASDAGRREKTPPMIAQRVWLNKNTAHAFELAGSFIMSSTSVYPHAFLYTPYGGLEKFDHRPALLAALGERLKTPAQAAQLLCFLPLLQQHQPVLDTTPVLTPEDIAGDVFGDQERILKHYQNKNREVLLATLKQLPSLDTLLTQLIESVARPLFPGLFAGDTQVSFFAARPTATHPVRWLDSLPINNALLLFYREQAWPAGQTREFFHPQRPPDAKDPQRRSRDAQLWETAIKQAAGQLISFLQSVLETFWNTDLSPGVSRRSGFAQVMAANARLDILLKRQQAIISPEQSRSLAALYLSSGPAPEDSQTLRFERPHIWEHPANVVTLANTLLIGNAKAYFYTSEKGLQVLGSYEDLMSALKAMVKAPGYEDDFYNLMSLQERALFIGFKAPQFSGSRIGGNLFAQLFDDIIAKQQQNLAYALDLYRRTRAGIEPSALVDHALDVRYMIDSRLLALDTAGRWTPHSVLADPTRPVSPTAQRTALMQKQLASIQQALAERVRAQPTLATRVNTTLSSKLNQRHRINTAADQIFVNRYDTAARATEPESPRQSQTLTACFVDRLTRGTGPIPQTATYGLYQVQGSGPAAQRLNLQIEQANAILDDTLVQFHNHRIADLPREHLEQLKASMAHAMSVAIQGEARLRRLNNSLDSRDEAMIQTVFDLQHANRHQRMGLDGFIPDAYAVTVEPQGQPQRISLANCTVLTERGGLDPSHSGRVLLWTPAGGLERFTDVGRLQSELERRLSDPHRRETLLANLDPSQREPHQRYVLGRFLLINESVAQHRQQSWINHYIGQRAHCLALGLPGSALLKRLGELERALPATNLMHTARIAQTLMVQQALPAWLGMAPIPEQRRHCEILEQYRHSLKDDKDYLDGFPSLSSYVSDTLNDVLKAYGVDARNVHITPRLVLAGQRQNLVDYALNHVTEQAATFDVESTATGLTPAVVRQILARLPLKQDNQRYLASHLTPGNPGAAEREQRFIRQLPWQLLQHAHGLMLQEQLSPTAMGLITQILDMPDAIARAAVKGTTALIRPLELIATAGARTIKALGVYLFNATGKGPLVIYTPYYPTQAFQEFDDEADFLRRLNLPGALQDWVVEHLPTAERATYKNLWASTVGQTAEITLASNPINGHALKQLYRDNIALMSNMLEQQTHTAGQGPWATLKALFTQGLQQAQSLLPAKVMLPLVIWQSYKLFKASAEDLQQHHWRHALETFIAGVAQMASMRDLMNEQPVSTTTPVQAAPVEKARTWQEIGITDQARTQRQPFETCDLSLAPLTAASSGVYTATDNHHYLPLEGKVYQAETANGQWRLFSARSKGPYVQLDSDRRWALDIRAARRRHGPGFSRYLERREVNEVVRSTMNVEARGMAQIRRISPHRAQVIVDALDLATFYLHNCQQNIKLLDPKYPPVTRVHRFINRFFGVPIDPDTGPGKFPQELSEKLLETITAVLDEALEPSLYSLNSTRFISGAHIADPERHWAFVIDDDPDRRIYLTENFFNPPTSQYEGRLTHHFDKEIHARATTLIHELTHIVSNTVDVAYLNSSSPFSDLIEVQTQEGRDLRTWLQDLQANAYSLSTPIGQLFKSWNGEGATKADVGTDPDDEYIRQQILATTGGVDLSNARGIFKTNLTRRFNTQMDNADSLTLLITTLGRQLDPVPSIAEATP